MFSFNTNHIAVGYIKEMLADFNLPNLRIYTKENQAYHDYAVEYNKTAETKIPTEQFIIATYPTGDHRRYITYIKDNELQQCYRKAGSTYEYEWKEIQSDGNALGTYFYNKKIPNLTKNIRLKGNLYDSYTHEYLGNYLRYLRDYNGLNLMPLYNCFSNKICTALDISITKTTANETTTISKFYAADTNYKIYMLPVKLFNKYTIAIDSTAPVEMCCGIYDKYQCTDQKFKNIPKETYKRFNSLSFNNPVTYDCLTDKTILKALLNPTSEYELAQNEQNLKLFIKLPKQNKSSIVILEGDYIGYNETKTDFYKTATGTKFLTKSNNYVTNYEYAENDKFKPITRLQLLSMNTGVQHAFSDRLLEYLLGSVICEEDTISDNISRLQAVMRENRLETITLAEGLWDDNYRRVLYDFMNKFAANSDGNKDILGYVDRDVEKVYKSSHIVTAEEQADPKSPYFGKKAGTRITLHTLNTIDIYPEQTEFINGGK